MRLKLRIALLVLLVTAALYTGGEAYRSLQPAPNSLLPEDIYRSFQARAEDAQFFLKSSGGYVVVYEDARYRSPLTVTGIETACLCGADRAMLEAGIPVSDRRELLLLLEDLGS